MPGKYGLTGGIACGKSTAIEIFAENGFFTQSSDAIVAEIYREDEEVRAAIRERFGNEVIKNDGSVDHALIRDRVFVDKEELKWIEGLIHPRVRKLWLSRLGAEKERPAIVEIPLLFEKDLANRFDSTICIYSSRAVQLGRLLERGLSAEEAERRISLQMPVDEKVKRSDFVIANDGSIDLLRKQINQLIGQIP